MNVTVDRAQVVAYRVGAHALDRRRRRVDDLSLLDIGVQDTPAGSARLALAARLSNAPDPAKAHALVWSLRGAPHYHRRGDLRPLAEQCYPINDADARKRLFDAAPALKKLGWSGLEGFAAAVDAMRAVVTRPMTKGEASARITDVLPREVSVDCRVCKSRHIREQIFRLAALPAGVELEPGTSPPVLRPRPRRGKVTTRAAGTSELVHAYLRVNGPAGAPEVAWFLQSATAAARAVMPSDVEEVVIEGREVLMPSDCVRTLRNAKPAAGARLLPPSDGLLRVNDRDVLVPEKRHRDVLYRVIGNPGAVLVDGAIAGAWRPTMKGDHLGIAVTAFARIPNVRKRALDEEARIVAAARGANDVTVTISA